MNQQLISNIKELLETMKEALEYLSLKEDKQMEEEFSRGRDYITACFEQELHRPICQWIEADSLSDAEWLAEIELVLDAIINPFQIKNQYDKEFLVLMEYIWKTTSDDMVTYLKKQLRNMKQNAVHVYNSIPGYFEKYGFWGTLHPEKGDYTSVEQRVHILKQHSFDFLWLYNRLEDYASKRTLNAILANWAVFDTRSPKEIKSIYKEYFEPDIFVDNQNDVFVDVGAYIGDSIQNYITTYGNHYKKIYAYEISPDSCSQLRSNTSQFHDVIIRQAGAGRKRDTMSIVFNGDSSANKLKSQNDDKETSELLAEIVPLDEDITEPITFIKMDIEGGEADALCGCERIIREQHPKLAICVYHGYNDLWKIPRMIENMNPDYRFYLRHYGENVLPTEFVLLCREE